MQKIPRLLDAADRRVLGALLEKEQTTPEVYPLTVNALVAACNQKTAREPVMELSEADVQAALRRLFEDVLVWRAESARVTRWRQSVERRWGLDGATKAIMTLLLLRGPQTIGELRNRSERLHAFASAEELEAALARLAAPPEPLIAELPRGPGQKEARWMHRVGDEPVAAEPSTLRWESPATSEPDQSLVERVAVLERRLDELERRIEGMLAPE